MKFLYTLAATALAVASPALAGGVSLTDFQAATADLATATGQPLEVRIADRSEQDSFLRVTGPRLSVTPETLALVGSKQEARALVALALTYQSVWFETPTDRRKSSLDYVSWIPAMIADSQRGASLPDARQIPNFTAEEQRERDDNVSRQRAALAVSLASKAGSCAGPMVDLLQRMRLSAAGSASRPDQPAGFARQALRDLGRTAYPPDRSCE